MTTRPELGRAAPFKLPGRESFVLDSGLRVTFVPVGSVPKTTLRLVLRFGAVNEPPGGTWLSRLTAAYLKEGTTSRSSEELASSVAGLGGRLSVGAGENTSALGMRVLSEHCADAVRLLAEVVRDPGFPPQELGRLISDLARDLALARTEPDVLASALFRAALYGDHPYGRVLSNEDTIDGFSTADVRAFYGRHAAAASAHLYVGGRFDTEQVAAAVREGFETWPAGESPRVAPPSPRSERLIHLADRPGAEQSTIYLGLPVPDPTHEDYVPLLVTNALLGGSFHSRVTLNIREDKGYAYSPRSSVSVRPRDGHWYQKADVTTSVTGAALHEIFSEIDRLRSAPPAPSELRGIQSYVAGTYVLRHATVGGVLNELAFLDLHGLDESYAAGFIGRVESMTPGDVQRIAADYLRPDDMAIAIAGDAAAIEDQIATFGEIVRESA